MLFSSPTTRLISPGGSVVRSLSSFKGTESKVRAEVRAVIFKDGSSAGDNVWVNAILARRLRFYDRILSIDDLLRPLVGTGVSREAVLESSGPPKQTSITNSREDDLRIMDDLVFHGAVSTFGNNRDAPVDVVLKGYLKYWEKRALDARVLAARSGHDPDSTLDNTQALIGCRPSYRFRPPVPPWPVKPGQAPDVAVPSCTVLGAEFDVPATQQTTASMKKTNHRRLHR